MNTYVLDSKNMFFATVIVKYESSWNSEVKEYLPQELSVVNFILNIKQDKYIVRHNFLESFCAMRYFLKDVTDDAMQ